MEVQVGGVSLDWPVCIGKGPPRPELFSVSRNR